MGNCASANKSGKKEQPQDAKAMDPKKVRKLVRDRRKKEVDQMLNQHVKESSEKFIEIMLAKGIDRVADDQHEEQIAIVLSAQKKMMNQLIDAQPWKAGFEANYLGVYREPQPEDERNGRGSNQIQSKKSWVWLNEDNQQIPFSDFDNELIDDILKRGNQVEKQDKFIEDHEKKIDLQAKTVSFKEQKRKVDKDKPFKIIQTNIRFRGLHSDKAYDTSGLILGKSDAVDPGDKQEFDIKDYQAMQKSDFGQTWFENNGKRVPSLKEVITGLMQYYMKHMVSQSQDLTDEEKNRLQKNIDNVTNKIYRKVAQSGVQEDLIDQPLQNLQSDINPASKVLLWIYTIEPSFYREVNNACRWFQEDKIDLLGPYAYVLGMITWGAQSNKFNKQNLDQLYVHDPKLGCFEKSFNVFRGARMKPEWITDWQRQVGLIDNNTNQLHAINLPGYTSTSTDVAVAMQFSAPGESENGEFHSVLFILTIRNYDNDVAQGEGFNGYDMQDVTAYPSEKEILLSESIKIYVMDVRHVISELYGNDYHVIHLLNIHN